MMILVTDTTYTLSLIDAIVQVGVNPVIFLLGLATLRSRLSL
jgi:hypothetical protein